jgi:hypothetical protein
MQRPAAPQLLPAAREALLVALAFAVTAELTLLLIVKRQGMHQ